MKQHLTFPTAGSQPILSFEFFPPKDEGTADKLMQTVDSLRSCKPDFVSITYGAGGSTRARTLEYTQKLGNAFACATMPHLTCVGHSRDELIEIIHSFRQAGAGKIMALRGDPPRGETEFKPHPNGLHHASELVALIRETFPECIIGVAGYPEKHPEAPSMEEDLLHLREKVAAGADFITTQLFFDNKIYFRFVDQCRELGITIPILPGLMSILSRPQAERFCDLCGTSIPQSLMSLLEAAGDDAEAVEAVGVNWTASQVLELLEGGAPGIHLYLLNRARPTLKLLRRLQAGLKLLRHFPTE
jgi:methylenetetrahydrofolate reductase (NADPH)